MRVAEVERIWPNFVKMDEGEFQWLRAFRKAGNCIVNAGDSSCSALAYFSLAQKFNSDYNVTRMLAAKGIRPFNKWSYPTDRIVPPIVEGTGHRGFQIYCIQHGQWYILVKVVMYFDVTTLKPVDFVTRTEKDGNLEICRGDKLMMWFTNNVILLS